MVSMERVLLNNNKKQLRISTTKSTNQQSVHFEDRWSVQLMKPNEMNRTVWVMFDFRLVDNHDHVFVFVQDKFEMHNQLHNSNVHPKKKVVDRWDFLYRFDYRTVSLVVRKPWQSHRRVAPSRQIYAKPFSWKRSGAQNETFSIVWSTIKPFRINARLVFTESTPFLLSYSHQRREVHQRIRVNSLSYVDFFHLKDFELLVHKYSHFENLELQYIRDTETTIVFQVQRQVAFTFTWKARVPVRTAFSSSCHWFGFFSFFFPLKLNFRFNKSIVLNCLFKIEKRKKQNSAIRTFEHVATTRSSRIRLVQVGYKWQTHFSFSVSNHFYNCS